jgi:hypothetical protein
MGWGPWTDEVKPVGDEATRARRAKTDTTEPAQPPPPTLTAFSTSFMTIEWAAAHDGGEEIFEFEVHAKSLKESGAHGPNRERGFTGDNLWAWGILPERVRWYKLCDSDTMNQETRKRKGTECFFTMFDAMREKYVFRMRCKNKHGWSLWSQPSAPFRMASRFTGDVSSEAFHVQVDERVMKIMTGDEDELAGMGLSPRWM